MVRKSGAPSAAASVAKPKATAMTTKKQPVRMEPVAFSRSTSRSGVSSVIA